MDVGEFLSYCTVHCRHAVETQDRLKQVQTSYVFNVSILQISDAVYRQVLSQTTGQYKALVEACEAQRVPLDARLRTDMDQIITSKEHVSNKIQGDQYLHAKDLLMLTYLLHSPGVCPQNCFHH